MKLHQPLSTTIKLFLLIIVCNTTFNKALSQCSVGIAIDSIILCHGDSTGVVSVVNQSSAPLIIAEVNTNSPDLIEIQNVTGAPLDLSGYYVACSNNYSNINSINYTTWDLSGTVPAGWVDFKDDSGGPNHWGSNLLFNSLSPGWVAICDASNTVVDIFFWEWTASEIANFAPVVNGDTMTFNASDWTGDGLIGGCATGSMIRTTNMESNTSSDWTCVNGSTPGVSNISISPTPMTPISSVLWSTLDTTSTVSQLPSGTYNVQVTFQGGCIAYDTITINQPAPLTSNENITDVQCFGESNGTAYVFANGGVSPYSYFWGSANYTMLPPGHTTYTITDSYGCFVMDSVFISEPTMLELTLSAQNALCSNDTIAGIAYSTLTGGTPGYTYTWSTGEIGDSISGLSGGWYTVNASDLNGCTLIDSVEIIEPIALLVTGITSDEINGNDGSIDLTVNGGVPPYIYSWTNGLPPVEDPIGINAGTYSVIVTDSLGCSITDTFLIDSQVNLVKLKNQDFDILPNPNNGTFKIISNSNEVMDIHVINNLGQIIYREESFDPQQEIKLDLAQTGIYFVQVFYKNSSIIKKILVE